MIRTSLAILFTIGLMSSAYADPTGNWSFETRSEIKGCTITGNMTISLALDGSRDCSFISQETCDGITRDPITMDQICKVLENPDNGHLEIDSTVVGSLIPDYDLNRYLPDNFYLDQISAEKMTGMWWDRNYSAPVIFWREKATPSS